MPNFKIATLPMGSLHAVPLMAKVSRLADGRSWRQGQNRTHTEIDLDPQFESLGRGL